MAKFAEKGFQFFSLFGNYVMKVGLVFPHHLWSDASPPPPIYFWLTSPPHKSDVINGQPLQFDVLLSLLDMLEGLCRLLQLCIYIRVFLRRKES